MKIGLRVNIILKTKKIIKAIVFTIILILFSLNSSLYAEIKATYTPASSFSFKYGDEISVPPSTPAGSFPRSRLVAHLGRIVITKDPSDNYSRPLMINDGGANSYSVRGIFNRWNPGTVQDTPFEVWAKNSVSSEAYPLWLKDKTSPLNGPGYNYNAMNQDTFIVDLFLVSFWESVYYVEDEIYTVIDTLGSFNIKVTTGVGHSGPEKFISVNNQTLPPGNQPPTNPIPIPEGGPGAPLPEIPFGEEEPPVELVYDFSIINQEPFILSDAYNTNTAKIGTALLSIGNSEPSQTYDVDIKFRNSQNTSTFSLTLDGEGEGYAIPYKLKFGNRPVPEGSKLDWYNLNYNFNEENIYVYNITPNTAQNAPAGNFKDTIIVEIFSRD